MKRLVSILAVLAIVTVSIGAQSCVRSKKSCKASHKRMKQMRKSGQIQM